MIEALSIVLRPENLRNLRAICKKLKVIIDQRTRLQVSLWKPTCSNETGSKTGVSVSASEHL